MVYVRILMVYVRILMVYVRILMLHVRILIVHVRILLGICTHFAQRAHLEEQGHVGRAAPHHLRARLKELKSCKKLV